MITLGIIGVVAAMTLPTVVNHYKRTEAETRLKKAYSVINQAFSMAVAKHGEVDGWELEDAELLLKKYIAPEIKGAKVYPAASTSIKSMCYEGKVSGNYVSGEELSQYGWMDKIYISTPFLANKTASIKLADGVCVGVNPKNDGVYLEQYVFIDINGSAKGPNMAGYDLFFFQLRKNSVVPYGYDWDSSKLSDASTRNSCHLKATFGGETCAAYIMSQGGEITYW